MTLFYYWQRFLFKLKAKNRHGIHSPFVFDFIESVVNCRISKQDYISSAFWADTNLNARQINIIERMCAHYCFDTIVFGDKKLSLNQNSNGIRLWIFEDAKEILWPLNKEDVVVILPLYSCEKMLNNWYLKINDTRVTLTINLFELGILFFKPSFKVKQHFDLLY